MQSDAVDELDLFAAVASSGARALLIGRRALVILGLPVMTSDYDFWIHIDDIETMNDALAPFGLANTSTPAEARRRGRYVLENGEHVDVMVAREARTVTGEVVTFEATWRDREAFALCNGIELQVPRIEDLIATKLFAPRPKDYEDVRLLEVLRDTKLGK